MAAAETNGKVASSVAHAPHDGRTVARADASDARNAGGIPSEDARWPVRPRSSVGPLLLRRRFRYDGPVAAACHSPTPTRNEGKVP